MIPPSNNFCVKNNKQIAFVVILTLIVVAATYLRLLDFFNPWGKGSKGIGGSLYQMISSSYLKYGVIKLKFAPYVEPYAQYYLVHPPLSFLLTCFAFYLFPTSESSIRFFPLLFSMAGILIFQYLIWKKSNYKIALAAVFFSFFIPINIYYGGMCERFSYGILILFLIFASYFKYIHTENTRYLVLMTLLSIIGVWFDFSIYHTIAIPVITHYFILRKKDYRLILYVLIVLLQIPLYFAYCKWVSDKGFSFDYAFKVVGRIQNITIFVFFSNIARFLKELYTLPVIAFSFVGIILWIKRSVFLSRELSILVLWCFLFGFFEYLTYYGRATYEEFHTVHLYPFVCITAGIGFIYLLDFKTARPVIWVKNILLVLSLALFLLLSCEKTFYLYSIRKTDSFAKIGNFVNDSWKEKKRIIVSFKTLPPQSFAYINENFESRVVQSIDLIDLFSSKVSKKNILYTIKSKNVPSEYKELLKNSFYKDEKEGHLFYVQNGR